MEEQRKTVCNRDCPDVCSIVATVKDGKVIRLQGDKEHPITRGFLCHRTSHFLLRQYAPDRITTPLIRRGDGELHPASWTEAMDLCAANLLRIRQEHGPAAIFHYKSGGSLGLLLSTTDLFFERFGPVTTKRGDICSGAGDAAQMLDFGEEDSNGLHDLLNARHIILWGKNVFTSSAHTIPVLKDAKAKGARIALIDPVHHQTASVSDVVLQPRPAGDVSLALAVGQVLFAKGWVHPEAASWCDHLPEFQALCSQRSLAELCEDAQVAERDMELLAQWLHDGPTAILVGWGMGRRANGASIVRCLDALGAITGNVGIKGGGVSFYFKRRGAFDTSYVTGASARTVCEPLFGQELLALQDPPVKAVWITAGNPVAMLPDSANVKRALSTREFVVVVDSWLSDTARLAHVVLPVNTLLEARDVMGSYGHHYLGAAKPVVPPPPGVKSDLEIMQELARRTGLEDVMAGTADSWLSRIMSSKLGKHGVTLETLDAGAVKNPLVPQVVFEGRRFPTPSGRVNLVTQVDAALPPDPEFPLVLMALSSEKSQSSQQVRPLEGPALLTVHPDAAGGALDGEVVELASRLGVMQVRVVLDARQRRDVALMAKGGGFHEGRSANALVRARLTDLGEGAALYDEGVRIRRLVTPA